MRVFVQGIPATPGADGVWRAGRKWPAGSSVAVEVLSGKEDPPLVPSGAKNTDGTPRMMPDPHRIGRDSFAALKADPRIRILSDEDTQGALNAAAVDAAKAEVAKLAAALTDAKAHIAGLEEENARLKVALSTASAGPTAPATTTPAGGDQTKGDEPPADQKGKGAKK